MSATTALYITPEQAVGAPRSRGRFLVTLITFVATIFIALVTVIPVPGITKATGHVASAGFPELFCSTRESLGADMGKNPWHDPLRYYSHEELTGRRLTLDEAVGQGLSWYTYEGEGGGSSWTVDVGKDRGAMYPKFKDTAINKRLMDARSPSTCIFVSLLDSGANLGLQIAKGITAIGQTAAVVVFDSSFICSDPTKNSGHCLNLVGIVGGNDGSRGSQKGIIGMLTNSVYMPLLVIVAAAAAFWILWNGVIKGRVRDAVFGFCWVLVSVILGIGFLQYPLLIAKAPMVASNTVASCVIGAFNGMDCTDGSATGDKTSFANGDAKGGNVCQSVATGGNDGLDTESSMSLAISSITCSIWKAFILEPYSQGNFNASYEDLNVDAVSTAENIKSLGLDPKDYCVNLSTTKSLKEMSENSLDLDGSDAPVCNVVAYQLSLGTQVNNKALDNAPDPSKGKNSTDPDVNWYKVVLFGARDSSAWNTWGPSITQGMSRIMLSGIMMLTALLGNALIVLISFNALVYYLTSAILIAFIPLFLLFGVHPGRGRKILIGYAEKVLSNIMKYLASAIFLVVTIAFYGGILGSLTSIGATLIFVIIITAALYVNREQIIELIGRVNMGGEQLASKAFSQTTAGRAAKRVTNKGKKLTRNAIGGGIGSVVANYGNDKSMAANFATGAGRGSMRELKRGHNMIAGTLREIDNVSRDNREDIKREASSAKAKAEVARTAADRNNNAALLAGNRMEESQAVANDARENLQDVSTKSMQVREAQEAVEKNVAVNGVSPDYARMEAIAARLQNLKLQHTVALATNDDARATSLQGAITQEQHTYNDMLASYNGNEALLATHKAQYDSALQQELMARGVDDAPTVLEQLAGDDVLAEAYRDYDIKRKNANFATTSYNSLVQTRNEQLATWASEQAKAIALDERYTEFGHDELYRRGKMKEELAALTAPRTDAEKANPKEAFDESNVISKLRKEKLDREEGLVSVEERSNFATTSAVTPTPTLPTFDTFTSPSSGDQPDNRPNPDQDGNQDEDVPHDRRGPDDRKPEDRREKPATGGPDDRKPEDRREKPTTGGPDDRKPQGYGDNNDNNRREDRDAPQPEEKQPNGGQGNKPHNYGGGKPSTGGSQDEDPVPQPKPTSKPEPEPVQGYNPFGGGQDQADPIPYSKPRYDQPSSSPDDAQGQGGQDDFGDEG